MKTFNGRPTVQDEEVCRALDSVYPLLDSGGLYSHAKLFQKELILGLANQRSSLPCILNPIVRSKPNPGFGVAVSIGGTNGYASTFHISPKEL